MQVYFEVYQRAIKQGVSLLDIAHLEVLGTGLIIPVDWFFGFRHAHAGSTISVKL